MAVIFPFVFSGKCWKQNKDWLRVDLGPLSPTVPKEIFSIGGRQLYLGRGHCPSHPPWLWPWFDYSSKIYRKNISRVFKILIPINNVFFSWRPILNFYFKSPYSYHLFIANFLEAALIFPPSLFWENLLLDYGSSFKLFENTNCFL